MTNDARSGLKELSRHAKGTAIPEIYTVVGVNVVTMAGCVSGANRLASVCFMLALRMRSLIPFYKSTSSVQTSLLLTVRKAVSLIISILLFGSGWNWGIVAGGTLVSVGTMLYSWPSKQEKMKTQ